MGPIECRKTPSSNEAAAEIRNASPDFPAPREKSATRALKRAELSEPAHCYISEALSHH
jgi:hypothetical protein